jgi:hypothetical protein
MKDLINILKSLLRDCFGNIVLVVILFSQSEPCGKLNPTQQSEAAESSFQASHEAS